MIVYRVNDREGETLNILRGIRKNASELAGCLQPKHEEVVDLLIEYGMVEAGVNDALFPKEDSIQPLSTEFSRAGLILGSIVCSSWEKRPGVSAGLEKFGEVLDGIFALPVPKRVRLRVPEGYAYYSLFPETYLEAARRFFYDVRPGGVVCIGLRSIGTSLAAVVGGKIKSLGCQVDLFNVRPKGHPFRRRLSISPFLKKEWLSRKGFHFLIVDEGPGSSGSTICSVAEGLSSWGIGDDRIIFFPSWEPDGSAFVSARARERWKRHRKYTAGFDEVWVKSGRLDESHPGGELLDISEGRWRPLFYKKESDSPPVHPYHERRKFLWAERFSKGNFMALRTGSRGRHPAMVQLLKFAGLGAHGRSKVSRAEIIAEGGFSPPLRGLSHGFFVTEFVPGEPLSAGNHKDKAPVLARVAEYLSFLSRNFSLDHPVGFERLWQMVRRNVLVGLGRQWVRKVSELEKKALSLRDRKAVAVDGRMLPHEWIRTSKGFLKTDGIDHYDDQFFPSSQDIAWDLAASCIEFQLSKGERDFLIDRYISLSGDRGVLKSLPFYFPAYLAFRMGVATFWMKDLANSPDAEKFRSLNSYYRSRLKEGLQRTTLLSH